MKKLKTIFAFEQEIKMQKNFLQRFVPQKPLSESQQKKTIFCGTGDSFVAAQIAQVFSNFRSVVFDPLDLLKNKKLVRDSQVYLISISGNTISNVKLAKAIKNGIGITANPQSKLAKNCKKTIILNYENTGVLTAGSISFLASFMTCLSLVSKITIRNVSIIYKNAETQSKKVSLRGKVFLLGNLHTFPLAMFGAAKLYEVTGLDAHYERIEPFSHMGLFSAKKGDTVIIFENRNKHNFMLANVLKRYGLNVICFDPKTKNMQEIILFFIFVSEFMALYHAKKKNQKDVYFVKAKKLRHVSSSMIY
jgi:fructoselysine-6-P-deglycase FrlB-like protein